MSVHADSGAVIDLNEEMDVSGVPISELVNELQQLINAAREQLAVRVNSAMTLLYWSIGERLNREVLGHERASYGEHIVVTVSRQLESKYGKGFEAKSVRRMMQCARIFHDRIEFESLSAYLSWSHMVTLIPIKDPLAREFYAELAKNERWSVRTLRERIESMLFERTAISGKPEQTVINDLQALRDRGEMSPDLVFRDRYVLDFLGLKDTHDEADLEAAILRELETFLLELGTDFAFVARQRRITIDGDDYYIDLLLYHRALRRLIVVELKTRKFKPSDKGQLEFYLRWLAANDQKPGEEPPLGLLLCTEGGENAIQLMELDQSGIHVGHYYTELPDPTVLRRKLASSVKIAQELRTSAEQSSRAL